MIKIARKRLTLFISAAFLLVLCFTAGPAAAADMRLAWDPSEDSQVTGYKVYYGTESRNYSASVDVGNQTTYTLTGLEDGRTYYAATTAYIASGEESDFSNEVANGSAPASSGGGSGGGGGCFIATAAYGSYMAPEVQLLRNFRDKWLMTNPAGRAFVSLYYKVSPSLADVIRDSEVLRGMARALLMPLVYAVKFPALALIALVLAGIGTMLGIRTAIIRSRREVLAGIRED